MLKSCLYIQLLTLICLYFNINASNLNPFQSPKYSGCVNIIIDIQHRNTSLSRNITESILSIISSVISDHLANRSYNTKPSLIEYDIIPFHIQFSQIITFDHKSAAYTFTNSLNTMETKETLRWNIESKTYVVIDEMDIYSLNGNTNDNMNKILALSNISNNDNISWLETSKEREYLYLVCGIVLICCWCICCISGILCYHDKNKTRRMEIELELEKLKSASAMPLIARQGSMSNAVNHNNNTDHHVIAAGYNHDHRDHHDHDEYINDYIRKTSVGAVSIATNNISRNRKHSDVTNTSHISHRSHHNNHHQQHQQQRQQQQQEESMIIANIPGNNDKIQVMTRRGHLKSKTEIEIERYNNNNGGGIHQRSKSTNIKGDIMEEKTYQMNINGNVVDMNLSKNIKKNAKKMRNKHENKKRRRIKREGDGYDGDTYLDPELTEILSSDNDNESLYTTSPKNEKYWTKGSGAI